jgi:beta-N-acetylhexosaminidase
MKGGSAAPYPRDVIAVRTAAGAALCLIVTAAAGCGGGDDEPAHRATAPQRTAAQEVVNLDPGAATTTPAKGGAPRPTIVGRPIEYGTKRRNEMAKYSKRHYGDSTWKLTGPQVIVEHYTASNSFESAYNTFANDTPDVELHELPGVCAHFIVDSDGTIYQLVSTKIRCRHTVGLNYTAIGIEHVGTSDGQVMGNDRQLRASLRLTRWLRCTQGIKVRNVIGHNESLSSPFHHENVASLRNQTHGDMKRATMKRYRSMLAGLGC